MLTQTRPTYSKEERRSPMVQETSRIPSDVFLWAAGASIVGSLALKAMKRDSDAIFVGHWAPTFLLLGIFGKVGRLLSSQE